MRFERSRKGSGEEDNFKAATAGAHLQSLKKKKMLAGWILDGGSCGKAFKSWMHQVSVKKTSGVFTDWLTQTEATTKYGGDQLKSMVASGTIQVRRLASDPRFFEFKSLTQRDTQVVEGVKKTGTSGDKKAISRDEMIQFSNLDPFAVTTDDFELDVSDVFPGSSSGSNAKKSIHDDLAKALNIKAPQNKEKTKVNNKQDPLEVMSQVLSSDTKDAIKKKLVIFKGKIVQESSTMEKLSMDLKGMKKMKEANSAMKACEVLDKLAGKLTSLIKAGNPKKEEQKKVLIESYEGVKHAKKTKSDLQKFLPKVKKGKVAQNQDENEDEEEEEEKDPEDQE